MQPESEEKRRREKKIINRTRRRRKRRRRSKCRRRGLKREKRGWPRERERGREKSCSWAQEHVKKPVQKIGLPTSFRMPPPLASSPVVRNACATLLSTIFGFRRCVWLRQDRQDRKILPKPCLVCWGGPYHGILVCIYTLNADTGGHFETLARTDASTGGGAYSSAWGFRLLQCPGSSCFHWRCLEICQATRSNGVQSVHVSVRRCVSDEPMTRRRCRPLEAHWTVIRWSL